MLKKDMTKSEIEEFLKGKGDFVQIDHLTRFLKEKQIPIDRKRFVCLKLAEIYEKKGMLREAAKMYNNIAIASIAFSEKIKNHVKEAELYIKSGNFEDANNSVKKAMNDAKVDQRAEIYVVIKIFYKKQAEVYEKQRKRSSAVRIYEKLLEMNISEEERVEIKEKLMNLYEKLGRLKEYFTIKHDKFDNKI
ncbi:MAG: hypothetical protein ABIH59_02035 [archaeon]